MGSEELEVDLDAQLSESPSEPLVLDWGEYPITTSEAAFSIAPLTPMHTFTMQNGEGKQAHVDFGGRK
jgi:hypothetical protein